MSAAEPTDGWTPMPEDEAIDWCRRWDLEKDVSSFCKWAPRIEGGTNELGALLGEAIELVWDQVKMLRPPCLTGDGHPTITFSSNPIASPSPNHNPAETDRAAVVEYNISIHNPLLPNVIEIVDYSKQTEVLHTEPAHRIALDAGELMNPSPERLMLLVFQRLDFRFREKAQVCGQSWIHEARSLERRERCPKCG